MAVLASTAAVRPQIYTNLQILDQLRETALWHDRITQDLPESLQYHINNLRLHVERANDHLRQASTHVENIGAHPEHYADSLARADGRNTMQPLCPKGQPKGRGKSRSMEPPSTATTAVQTDPIPPYTTLWSPILPHAHRLHHRPIPVPPSPKGQYLPSRLQYPTNACSHERPTQQTTFPSRYTGSLPTMGRSRGVHSPAISDFQRPGPGPSHIHHPHPYGSTDNPYRLHTRTTLLLVPLPPWLKPFNGTPVFPMPSPTSSPPNTTLATALAPSDSMHRRSTPSPIGAPTHHGASPHHKPRSPIPNTSNINRSNTRGPRVAFDFLRTTIQTTIHGARRMNPIKGRSLAIIRQIHQPVHPAQHR